MPRSAAAAFRLSVVLLAHIASVAVENWIREGRLYKNLFHGAQASGEGQDGLAIIKSVTQDV
jgi:hypothetical protein